MNNELKLYSETNVVGKLLELIAYIEDINIDIIDDELIPGVTLDEVKVLKEALGKFKSLTVEGIDHYIDTEMYRDLIVFGRNVPLEKIAEVNKLAGIELSEDDLQTSYTFSCDLYDDNEADGWNDEHYPNRKKLIDTIKIVKK